MHGGELSLSFVSIFELRFIATLKTVNAQSCGVTARNQHIQPPLPTMPMKTRLPLSFAALALLATTPVASAQDSDIEALKIMVKDMQKTILEQNARIATLEMQKSEQATVQESRKSPKAIAKKGHETSNLKSQVAATESEIPVETSSTATYPQKTSAVPDADTFADLQQAAPRVNNAPLEPELKGFIKIPGTDTSVKIGGSVCIDSIVDFGNSGNPNLFTPSSIPVESSSSAATRAPADSSAICTTRNSSTASAPSSP